MKKRMSLVITGVVSCLIVLFGAIFGWDFIRNYFKAQFIANFRPPAQTVSALAAKAQNWQPTLPSVGSLAAINSVEVTGQQSGMVVKINFKSGQIVKKGQSLVQQDDALEVQQLKDYQAQLTYAQLNFNRQARLYKQAAVSKDEYDTATASLKEKQAQVAKQQVTIEQMNIKAPFDGKIGIREVNLGQYLTPGSKIASLQSLNPLFINFSLPEQYLPNLYIGQKVSVSVDAYPGQQFYGKITALNSTVTTTTRNINIQGVLPNPNYKLYPGSFANVQVLLKEQKQVVTIPQTAVTSSLYGNIVYVLTPALDKSGKQQKDKQGKAIYIAKQVFVKAGQRKGDVIAIESGLKAGDIVVSSGQLKLHNDIRVTINNSVKLPALPQDQLQAQ